MCSKGRTLCVVCLSVCLVAGAALPLVSRAQVINEVMYDVPGTDTGREWVEILNNTLGSVDLTGWKFLESPSASNHVLSLVQGGASLDSNGYAVIVIDPSKFLSDNPSYSGTIFKASFSSLNNSGSTLTLKNSSGSVIDQATYASTQGASGDGNTLQKQSDGTWIVGVPTPGVDNTTIAVLSPASSSTPSQSGSGAASSTGTTDSSASSASTGLQAGDLSAHYSFAPVTNDTSPTLTASVGRDRLTLIGEPVEFKAVLNTNDANTSYLWNFGDGASGVGKYVSHAYALAGDYTVVLNVTLLDNEAVSRTSVKVVEPELSLTETTPSYAAVKNSSRYEANLYGWSLVSGGAVFDFPKDTLIEPGQTLKFASSVTKLAAGPVALVEHPDASSMRSMRQANEAAPITMSTISTAASIAAPVTAAHADAAEIQAVADKLVALNQKIRGLAPISASPAAAATSTLEASVVESLPAAAPQGSSWLNTLKTFFGLK